MLGINEVEMDKSEFIMSLISELYKILVLSCSELFIRYYVTSLVKFSRRRRTHTHTHIHRNGGSLGNLKRFNKLFPTIRTKRNIFLEAGVLTSSHLERVKRRALTLFSPRCPN